WGGASPPAVQRTELDSRRTEPSSRARPRQRNSPPACCPPAPPPPPLLPRRLLTRLPCRPPASPPPGAFRGLPLPHPPHPPGNPSPLCVLVARPRPAAGPVGGEGRRTLGTRRLSGPPTRGPGRPLYQGGPRPAPVHLPRGLSRRRPSPPSSPPHRRE